LTQKYILLALKYVDYKTDKKLVDRHRQIIFFVKQATFMQIILGFSKIC